jgi:hypothetical protein
MTRGPGSVTRTRLGAAGRWTPRVGLVLLARVAYPRVLGVRLASSAAYAPHERLSVAPCEFAAVWGDLIGLSFALVHCFINLHLCQVVAAIVEHRRAKVRSARLGIARLGGHQR